jgi:hypothetical protein
VPISTVYKDARQPAVQLAVVIIGTPSCWN